MQTVIFFTDWTPIPTATSNVQDRYYSSATPIASSIAIDLLDATTPMHASARTRKRIVLSDDEDSLEEDVGYRFCIP